MSTNAVAERPQQQVQTTEMKPIVELRTQLESRADEFRMVLPSHITPEKFQRTVITAVQQNPKLLQCSRLSFITACMKAAQDALLPDGREAALVPFNTRQKVEGEWKTVSLVQYMPMVYGLRKKILQSGEVKDIFAAVVYRQEVEAGLFVYEEGTERALRHKPLLDPAFDPSDEDICAAYSVATYKDGSLTFEVMARRDINKVRQCSQTGATGKTDRQGNAINPSGPWVDWFSEQAKKSVIRRHSKTLPMSGDIVDVEALDELIAARSTGAYLSAVEPDEPAAIPPRRITAPEIEDDGEIIDAEPITTQPAAGDNAPAEAEPLNNAGDAAAPAKGSLVDRMGAVARGGKASQPAPEGRSDDQHGEYDAIRECCDRLVADARAGAGRSAGEQAEYEALPDDMRAEVDAAAKGGE